MDETRVKDLNKAQKNCFNGISDKTIDDIVAEVEERFSEKGMQVLKDLKTVLNPAPNTEIGIWNCEKEALKDPLRNTVLKEVQSELMKQEMQFKESSSSTLWIPIETKL